MSQQNYPQRPQEEEIDLREQLEIYFRYWPWFIVGFIICVAIAFFYLRTATPVYNTIATIIIKDEEGGMSSELSAFADMGMFEGMGTNNIENEIGILNSKRLLNNVVEFLNLNVRYFQEEELRTVELYEDSPVRVQILNLEPKILAELEIDAFEIEVIDSTSFRIRNEDLEFERKAEFGTPLEMPFGEIMVTPSFAEISEKPTEPILVTFASIDAAVAAFRDRIQVNLTEKNSTLIALNLESPEKQKAQDILNRLIFEYNQEAIEDKNQVSLKTAEFIEERLDIISAELDSVETGKQQFKTRNRLTDIKAESQLFIENASEFRKEQLEVETQLELANSMIDYLKDDEEGSLLPANLGFSEEALVASIEGYNKLVLERDRILEGSTAQNPVIINLNRQIAQIKANVMQSLLNLRNSLLIAQEDLEEREAAINAQIADVPAKEKQYRGIERQQNIKEALYLFLLQKREETSLSLAATAPKAKIVDSAYSTNEPVSPKPKIILLAAAILGLLIPFLVIYIRNLLNNKIHSRADIEKEAEDIPIVGEVPRIGRNENELIDVNDRSVLAESFRILHTNLQYLLLNVAPETGGNTIFVTSTVKGEGKTFVSFNLAITLANAGKKVLIVGADLRNPQLQRYETDARKQLGVSDFLVNEDHQLEDLIHNSAINEKMDILSSGSIPPNPSELWRQSRTEFLFRRLKEMYDYVIVDTAPAMLVTDTFLINRYADLTLYVSRAGYTEKKLLHFAADAKKDGKLHDMAFVLNDVKLANFGYGNKYGYVYGAQKEGFWEKIKSRF